MNLLHQSHQFKTADAIAETDSCAEWGEEAG